MAFNRLSIVIPVGPDDLAWRQLLDELAEFGSEIEIIVAACQYQPDDYPLPVNVRWLQVEQGRAGQLNAGAQQSEGAVLWFVHADSRMTAEVKSELQRFLQTGQWGLGYFRLRFADDGPWLTRLNAWAANLRSRFCRLPFGDQGFVVRKSVFEQLQGFDESIALGEDLDFVVRLKAAGLALRELPADLITSARRYRQQGWWRTTWRHVYLTCVLTRQARKRLVLAP